MNASDLLHLQGLMKIGARRAIAAVIRQSPKACPRRTAITGRVVGRMHGTHLLPLPRTSLLVQQTSVRALLHHRLRSGSCTPFIGPGRPFVGSRPPSHGPAAGMAGPRQQMAWAASWPPGMTDSALTAVNEFVQGIRHHQVHCRGGPVRGSHRRGRASREMVAPHHNAQARAVSR